MTLRPASDIVNGNTPEEVSIITKFLAETTNKVLICGLPKTGKTTFLKRMPYDHRNIIKWDRGELVESVYGGRNLNPKLFPIIEKFEKEFLTKLEEENPYDLQVRTVTGNSFASRQRILEPKQTILLVFDGPDHLITKRKLNDPLYMLTRTEVQVEMETALGRSNFSAPTFHEEWKRIIYVNTFGEEGEEFLLNTVYTL
jgi:Cdc6-like AAA superfamily ATPase